MTQRGIRNNNPGNIKDFGIPWEGILDREKQNAEQRAENTFVVFSGPWWGIRAIAKILLNYQTRHGLDTVHKIIDRWAPAGDSNEPERYARFVANHIGVHPHDPIDVTDYTTMLNLAQGIVWYENGTDPYTWEYITGLIMAGIEPPA